MVDPAELCQPDTATILRRRLSEVGLTIQDEQVFKLALQEFRFNPDCDDRRLREICQAARWAAR